MYSLSTLNKLNGPEPEASDVDGDLRRVSETAARQAHLIGRCEQVLGDDGGADRPLDERIAALKHDCDEASAWCDVHREDVERLQELLGFAQTTIDTLTLPDLTPEQREAAVRAWVDKTIKTAVGAPCPKAPAEPWYPAYAREHFAGRKGGER